MKSHQPSIVISLPTMMMSSICVKCMKTTFCILDGDWEETMPHTVMQLHGAPGQDNNYQSLCLCKLVDQVTWQDAYGASHFVPSRGHYWQIPTGMVCSYWLIHYCQSERCKIWTRSLCNLHVIMFLNFFIFFSFFPFSSWEGWPKISTACRCN